MGQKFDLKFSLTEADAFAENLLAHGILMIGFDAEWVERDGGRQILSYQTYLYGGANLQQGHVFYTADGERQYLEEVLARTVLEFLSRNPSVKLTADSLDI